MKKDAVLLTKKDVEKAMRDYPHPCKPYEDIIAKAAQLKLLDVLNKTLYEICPHKEYPQRNKIDCTLCVIECMSEIEKLLKEG